MRRVTFILTAAVAATVLLAGGASAQPPSGMPPLAQEADEDAADEGFCDRLPWGVETLCGAVGDVVGGTVGVVVGSGAKAALSAVVGFVVDGAGWLLGQVGAVIDDSTRPELTGSWFQHAYRDMTAVAVLGLLPFLLLALVQALVRQDVGLLLRASFAYLPLAAIGTTAAVVVVDLLVELTDVLSAWIARSMGSDLEQFTTGLGTAVSALTLPLGGAVAGLAAVLGAGLIAFAAFVIWLELLLRQAAIYVAVLFLPLGFMAMVWPATAHWLRRLAQGLVAIILSKFVIAAVMALAATALNAEVAEDGFVVVVSGAALLGLAALAPYVLLRLIPVFEAGLASDLEGTYRRPTAAVATPVTGGQVTQMVRSRVGRQPESGAPPTGGAAVTGHAGGGPSGGSPPIATAPGGAPSGAGAGAGAATGAAGGVILAGGAAARRAGAHVGRTASDTAEVAGAAGGSPSRPATAERPPPNPRPTSTRAPDGAGPKPSER